VMYHMPNPNDTFRECTILEYYDCVVPLESSENFGENCSCNIPCRSVKYDQTISLTTLSATANYGIQPEFNAILNVRHRMIQTLFVSTLQPVYKVIGDLNAYLAKAEELSNLGPTSMFSLLQEALLEFCDSE